MRRLVPVTDFETVAKALYGDGAWEIAKAEKKKTEGLSNTDKGLVAANAASAGFGALTLPALARDAKAKFAKPAGKGLKRVKPSKLKATPLGRAAGRAGKALKNPKFAGPVAGAVVGGQVFNVAADAASTKSIADKSKKKTDVTKSVAEAKVKVLRKVEEKSPKVKIARKKEGKDFTISATVSKAIEDKRQVYGWASITEMDGQPVVDLQGDYTTIEEIEKAAHKYISKSRKGGDMHVRVGDEPKHVADLIESVVITPEKKEALGIPADSPTGWWVGMQVHDDETWQLVKDGKRPMFSVHGSGRRQEMEIPA
jgi:hypothetical protein